MAEGTCPQGKGGMMDRYFVSSRQVGQGKIFWESFLKRVQEMKSGDTFRVVEPKKHWEIRCVVPQETKSTPPNMLKE